MGTRSVSVRRIYCRRADSKTVRLRLAVISLVLKQSVWKRTKKLGVVGKYGTRYGASLRKQVKKMEITQHAKYTCTFCGKVTLKRPEGKGPQRWLFLGRLFGSDRCFSTTATPLLNLPILISVT
ncbi:MAG: ribosomal L37ae protein family-domain-containing protein [Olpidium bornovanus]|uniref:Ribosomal L37ae protein family-domain-containing protein n=1 Tax=Olpidium bornovanus TaxID=278681 RepID=A0A8H8DIJ5_9FUNG|nr:MAG: ribosomal L37ae protein family-domain-containing protein [Olpidium bornovanus]